MHSARTESEASSWLETGSEDTAESEYEYYWSKSGTGWVMTQTNTYIYTIQNPEIMVFFLTIPFTNYKFKFFWIIECQTGFNISENDFLIFYY